MAFSWKKTLATQLKGLKDRKRIHLKNGENVKAKECDYRIEKLEKVIKDGS